MWQFLMDNEAIFWILIAAVFALIEVATMTFTTIWFALGSFAAALTALTGAPYLAQVVVFFAVSLLLLYFTKPILIKRLKLGSHKTNVDALIGQPGLVTKSITPYESGLVKVSGIIWTSQASEHGITIEEGSEVIIERIEGVRLVVRPSDFKKES